MKAVVRAEELSRWYGIVMGLNNVTFEVGPGITGLVGPNGAGKTTLIQIITGQLRQSSGRIQVLGEAPWNHPALLRRIGFCPEGEAVHEDLTPTAWLTSLGLLSGIPGASIRRRAEAVLDQVKLGREHWEKRLSQCSKGMRQRVKLAQALLHEPELLVLDEPMNGLDPMGRQETAQILRDLARRGTHIIVSSHILAELETLCESVLILNWGRVIASGSRGDIRRDLKNWSEQLSVRCDRPEALARLLFEADLLLGFDIDLEEGLLRLRIKSPNEFFPRWPRLLLDSGVTVYELRSETQSLHQIFDRVTA